MTRLSAREIRGTEGPFGLGVEIVRPLGIAEDAVVSVLRVPPEAAGMRLDRFVQGQLKRTSRTRAQAIIAIGAYGPDARRLRGNDRVKAEQLVLLWRAPWDEDAPAASLPVLYEDAQLLAIDKPAGVPVHPTARYHKTTVVKILEAQRGERLRLSHRLDRETSGVLLLARTAEADRHVKLQFQRTLDERAGTGATVDKTYVALAWGDATEASFRVDLPLELDPTNRYRVKMRIAKPGSGQVAATRFEVLGRRQSATGRRYSLLRCFLETGRQHQIRVHLAACDLSIVGDKLYGPDDALFARGADRVLTAEDRALLELERQALHAERLELGHPTTGQRLCIEAPLPDDILAFWRALEPIDEAASASSAAVSAP